MSPGQMQTEICWRGETLVQLSAVHLFTNETSLVVDKNNLVHDSSCLY